MSQECSQVHESVSLHVIRLAIFCRSKVGHEVFAQEVMKFCCTANKP